MKINTHTLQSACYNHLPIINLHLKISSISGLLCSDAVWGFIGIMLEVESSEMLKKNVREGLPLTGYKQRVGIMNMQVRCREILYFLNCELRITGQMLSSRMVCIAMKLYEPLL